MIELEANDTPPKPNSRRINVGRDSSEIKQTKLKKEVVFEKPIRIQLNGFSSQDSLVQNLARINSQDFGKVFDFLENQNTGDYNNSQNVDENFIPTQSNDRILLQQDSNLNESFQNENTCENYLNQRMEIEDIKSILCRK